MDWGADQETSTRKQSGEIVTWKEAPALQHQKHWYWPPAPTHPTTIALRKGIDKRYAPYLFTEPTVLDQRLYVVSPQDGVSEEILQAYFASSLFPLSFETNGDVGLGAGVLTMGANNLRSLPSVDLKGISAHAHSHEALEAARELFRGAPPDAEYYPDHAELRRLDEALLKCIDLDPSRAQELEMRVAELQDLRVQRAQARVKTRKETSSGDIETAAHNIIEVLQRWLGARRFPEDWIPEGSSQAQVLVPQGSALVSVDVMLNQATLTVESNQGAVLLQRTWDIMVGEVVLKALLMGRRQFSVPENHEVAETVMGGFRALLEEYESLLEELLAQSPLGPRYDSEVRGRVARATRIRPDELRHPLDYGAWKLE